jgi:hypothetical protein
VLLEPFLTLCTKIKSKRIVNVGHTNDKRT